MPRRKIERTLEEQEEFQQRRREKRAEYQRHRQIIKLTNNISKKSNFRNYAIDIAGTIYNKQIIELNDEIGENSLNVPLIHQQIICTSDSIPNNRIIELNEDMKIIGENLTNIIPVCQQHHADYQSYYRSQRRQLHHLDINRILIDDINEYYIGSMDISCTHCNAKHFAAEKISNKGNSFHDCCNHGAVYLQLLPQLPQFLRNLFDDSHIKSNNFFKHIRTYNSFHLRHLMLI